jgi:hypothetical protein
MRVNGSILTLTIDITLVLVVFLSSTANAGIGIFSTPDGSDCNLNLPPFWLKSVYVLYLGQGGPMANGAEYRIAGMPGTFGVTFTATLTPAPGSIVNLGNAFDGTGHNVAWPAVQPFDANGNLLLATYALTVLGASVPAGTDLSVEGRNPPCNFCWGPLITDAGFNLIWQDGGNMRVNGGPTCTVAVQEHTWTEIRNLYR